MKLVVGILLVTVAAMLVVTADAHDTPAMQKAIQSVLQMCRDVVKTTISEEVGEMCKKENVRNITSECFPEMGESNMNCIANCMRDSKLDTSMAEGSQDNIDGVPSMTTFVEALLTKKRKMCIMSIMKECVQEKTGIMLP